MTSKQHSFVRNILGVHFVSFNPEFTLCGDAIANPDDKYIEDFGPFEEWPHRPAPVTCPDCADILNHCSGVKFSGDAIKRGS